MCHNIEEEIEYMSKVSYSSGVATLMYAMGCTRQDISYAMGFMVRCIKNLGKEHYKSLQWILEENTKFQKILKIT